LLVFGKRFERFERVIPESLEISADAFDTGRVQLVDTTVSDLAPKDQIGVLEHSQMLGHSWAANRKTLGDLVDCGRAFGQTFKNR
jgi:hypothetical protein